MPERAASTASAFVRQFRNLTGLPSHHYDGVFGRIVHEQFASAPPGIVALELPAAFRPALKWAASCWPTPVAALERKRSDAMRLVVPFVPGDSMLEAYRLASQAGIAVALVDLDASVKGEQRPASTLAVGPEFAARPGDGFFEAVDAVNERAVPLSSDLAREAAMAAALAVLMTQHTSVWWVGGFAHWTRIVERLRTNDFDAPAVQRSRRRRFVHASLGASALVRLTGQYPAMVASFSLAPQRFEPFDAMRALLREAAASLPDDPAASPESASAIDLARTGLYARNLAASARISEQPQLAELVLAANTTIGPRYAARLVALATAEHVDGAAEGLAPLTFEVDPRTARSQTIEAGFCFRGRRLSAEPWFPVPWPLLDLTGISRLTNEAGDAQYERLPVARRGETFQWRAYPPDEEAYERFVRYALRRAAQPDEADRPSVPFVSGLGDGLDVRTTIRFWHDDRIYVHPHRRPSAPIRNGVIDWSSRTEDSEILRGEKPDPGWDDPDLTRIASVSRALGYDTIAKRKGMEVTRRWREWSFITLDHPTLEQRAAAGAVWKRVIEPLLGLDNRGHATVYDWLDVVFKFCEWQPFVYYSQYKPSARIYALARSHDVQLRWRPLGHLSAALVARHRWWRQLLVSKGQWKQLLARLGGGASNGYHPRAAGAPVRNGRGLSVQHPRRP